MNKSRELFLLFPYTGDIVNGYSVVHSHRFPNDEPPYIMVTFWGAGLLGKIYEEDGESGNNYLIRSSDLNRFIALQNGAQREYCDYYIEGVLTRNAGEHNLKPEDYVEGAKIRKPKIKYMNCAPIF